jgi:16S rRNA (uracil1498-N3)-methyltransferase
MAPPGEPPVALPAQLPVTGHVFVDRLDDRITIDGDDGHHLQRARRVRAGEEVTAADGYGRWRSYRIDAAGKGRVDAVATSLVAHEPFLVPRLTVACALTKGQKPELVVQKLTELGVDRIMLVEAARSVVQWDEHKVTAAFERLARVAREAAMQSRRARVPVVDGPVAPAELVGMPGLVVAGADGAPVATLDLPAAGEWVVAVGPEGGFDDDELGAFGTAPRLSVGPFVLRAETAAIAVAAAIAGRRTISSDWDDRREW